MWIRQKNGALHSHDSVEMQRAVSKNNRWE
jgi:hypothetical protein